MEKLKKYIARDKSVITGKQNLELLYSMKNFPVFFGCVETPEEKDLFFDMDWSIDPETGVIQLSKLIPLDLLYQMQHADGYGPTWHQYYVDFSSYIKKDTPNFILEIGGGGGALAKIATDDSKSMHWTIVEPNPTAEETEKIKIVRSFFGENFNYDGKIDAIVLSQVLEHAYDPNVFLSSISRILKKGGCLILAYPNLLLWLQKKQTNSINFEHTMLLTDYHIDYLLAKHGFLIINKEQYKDHSFFYTVEKVNNPPLPPLENKYKEYKKAFFDFVDYHKNITEELNKKIEEADLPVYLFGAHIFSQYLLFFGLKTEKIISILDNSATKQGKRLYGTKYKVESPKYLAGRGPLNIILKAGPFDDEIKKDILENINPNVIFW
ncbi:MAG: hypothetical protein UV20_C0018G0007 [Candidatus Magasanikbacteria bacterium GW2011_GWA2_42_32]|uniref:Uncharacterized protein n=1 Tax=Candidatus Magasanikbacteria bacterium GW2011_GWA2_42_32 TaxID=1619039 RepID=A0A0G1A4Z0_9BACT|nr:MAG: hypothetical protein UV20_C0018G0007 [Candidatus Magasanikbacteria bacterium GW2011_GWA2_42_32]